MPPLTRALLFVALSAATRLWFVGVQLLDVDEASYYVSALEWLRGGHLYLDVADHKPPLVFAYYALTVWLPGGMVPVRLLTVLVWVPLTALAVSAFYGHDRRGLWAAIAWLLFSAAFLAHDMHAVNCELLMMLPLAGALAVASRRGHHHAARAFIAGTLVGIATLFKYQGAAWLVPVVLLATGATRHRTKLLLAVGGGWALPLAGTLAAFAASDNLDAFLYWNIDHNLAYALEGLGARRMAIRAVSYAMPWAVSASPLVWAWRRAPEPDVRTPALLAAVVVTVLAAAVGGRFYPHYFIPAYVPLALGAGPWLASQLAEGASRSAARFAGLALALTVTFTAVNSWLYRGRAGIYNETRPALGQVATWIAEDSCRQDASLFVWGYAPAFYLSTGLRPASRFLWVDSTLVGHVSGARADFEDPQLVSNEHWAWLLDDLSRNRPTYIIDAARAGLWRWRHEMARFPKFGALVATDYEPVGDFDGALVYRRLGCGSASTWRFAEAPGPLHRGMPRFGATLDAVRRRVTRGRG